MKLLTIGEQIVAPISDGYVEHSDHYDSAGIIITKYPDVVYTVVDIPGDQPWDFSTTAYVVRDGKLVYSEIFKMSQLKYYSNRVRGERDARLSESDWTQLPDTFIGDEQMKAECAEYRRLVRNVTEQAGFPFEVEWPTRPEPLKLLKISQRMGGM